MNNETYGGAYEKEIEEALIKGNIKYSRNQRLDFYLPDYGVYLEVKQYNSDRTESQLKSQENVIIIQGIKSVNLIISLLTFNN